MNKNDYISSVLSQIFDKSQKRFIEMEISDHIDDRTEFYLGAGFSAEEAECRAVEHMGDSKELGMQMNQLYNYSGYNKASLVFLIISSIYIFARNFMQLNLFGGAPELTEYAVAFLVPFVLVMICAVLRFCRKTKNRAHLIWLGVIAFAELVPYITRPLGSGFDNYDFGGVMVMVMNILSNDRFSWFATVASAFVMLLLLYIGIVSLGFASYINSVLKRRSSTDIMLRYERLATVPIISLAIFFIVTYVLYIFLIKGAFING